MFRLLIEVILALLVLILNAAVMLLGGVPRLLRALRWLAQLILVVSCDFYRAILSRLSPLVLRVRINLMANPWRTIACIVLSILLGLAIMLLAGWEITPPAIAGCAGHGLLVGVVWDQLGPPNGIRMGV